MNQAIITIEAKCCNIHYCTIPFGLSSLYGFCQNIKYGSARSEIDQSSFYFIAYSRNTHKVETRTVGSKSQPLGYGLTVFLCYVSCQIQGLLHQCTMSLLSARVCSTFGRAKENVFIYMEELRVLVIVSHRHVQDRQLVHAKQVDI